MIGLVSATVATDAPVANFTANTTSGTAPLTVQFTDISANATSWAWDFNNDGTVDSTEQNPAYTYSKAGIYSVNLTVSNAGGSNSEVKTEYITVTSAATNDLSITGLVNTVPGSAVFAKESNTIKVLNIMNTGTASLSNISVALYASDVSNGTVPVNTTTISSLAGGAKTTVSLIDPTIRNLEGGTVTYTAVVDPDNLIPETNEANNNKSSAAKPLRYNGYKGKGIYWEGESNITTKHTYDLQGNLLYSTQPDTSYKAVGWTGRTETWTADELPIPSGSTIEKVFLYFAYNWDQTPGGYPWLNLNFNGNTIENGNLSTGNGTLYRDWSNFGGYADYEYGLCVYDVTSQFSSAGNSLVTNPYGSSYNKVALYPSTLVVIYRDSNETRKQIFINEECDELGVSESSYGTTPEEATAYAPFTGMSIDKSNVTNATMYSFAGSAGPDEGNLLFNGNTVAPLAWQGSSNSASPLVFNATNYINETGNEAGIQGTTSGGMDALQQILVVDYQKEQEAAPVANFTANVTSGTAPLTVNFTDQSTGNISSYSWDFDNDGTVDSTEQNPVYTYTAVGNYTVNLTVSNAGGSDSKVKTEYIVVSEPLPGAPVANFTATPTSGSAPLTVNFTDQSTGNVSSYSWDFNNDGTVDSTEQNPAYTYSKAGTYSVNLTVMNSVGNDSEVKMDYITVEGTGTGGLADTAWPKYQRDLNNTGQSPYNGPQTNSTIWNYNTGTIRYVSPVIGADGTIYIGSYGDKKFYALNPDGTLKWTYNTGSKIYDSAAIGKDGTIYIGSADKNLYALNPDGTLKWTYTTGSYVYGSAAIGADGTIYIGNADKKLYAINPDGTLKWTYDTGYTISGSVAIGADGTIYVGSNKLYALNPDGTLKWTYNTWSFYQGSPSIGTDETIYTGSYGNDKLYALNPNGTLKWAYTTGQTYGCTPAIATDGTVYMGSFSNKQVYAINPNGTLKWTYTTGAIYGSISLGADGTIYIGSRDKNLYALNSDGTLKWTYTTGGEIYGSPAIAADGALYIGTYDGKLYAFKDTAPVANFTATPTLGAPLTIQFNDTSSYYPTSWTWDFGDNETSTEQNPVHTYAKAGNYTVTLTAANDYGSDTETKTENFVIPVVTSITIFPTSIRLYQNETQQFSAAAVDQLGTNMSDVAFTWSSSNETVGTVNASGLFTSLAPGITNVTASSGNVSASAEVTVIGPSPDLIVSSVTSSIYPSYYNKVTATIKNEGTADAGTFKTNFTLNGNTTSVEITGLTAGNSTTVSITDMVHRKSGDSISITVTADPENTVAEANESNNEYNTTATITASGDRWQGGRFSVGSDLVNNAVYEEGHIGAVYSVGSTGYTWFTKTGTVTYTTENLPIPADATIKSARIYQGWTWYGYPGFTVQFNGHESQAPNASYSDCINGQDVFDVTPYFNASGSNTAVITAGRSQAGYYGTVLVVIYESASEPYRQIWINEGSDCLLYGTKDPYVSYTLMDNVSTAGLKSAKLTTILESRDGDDGTATILNGKALTYTGSGGSDPSFMYFDATSALKNGTNELGVNGSSSYTNYAASILEITKETASEANFTADTTSGNAPLIVNFTDTSTGTPANWTWDFGDGKTSTEQNPTHIYTTEGNYTVKLTVSNSLGNDSEEKTGYITVGSAVLAPEANFSSNVTSGKAPLSVQFTDESTNTPTSWEWNFGDGKTSTEQNPVHTYETTGIYTVNLTATNYGGSNSTTKTDYINVTSDSSAPVASFTTDSNSGKVPLTVHFTDTTTGSVSSWNWDFGDGSTSTDQNPTHTYVTEGSYNVTLTATGPGGSNTSTSAEPITVSAPLTSPSYNGGIPLTTAQNGTVSGGLWYDSYYAMETSAQKTFTLPDYTKIKWARLYVTVYDGHMENNYRGNVSIGIDANGDSTYEIQKNETFDTSYSFPGTGGTGPVWLSDHMNRVTSDYLMWYDLTDAITGQQVNVQATTSKIDSSFDGRVKSMTLVIAYDDGDFDQVYYWVNQGHDTVNPSDTEYTGSTAFSTSSLASGWSSANLTAIYLASKDGVYTFNGTTLASGVASGSYYGANTWDISSLLTAGQDSALAYNKQGSSYYKIPLVLMSIKYAGVGQVAPTADFSANVTEGKAPLTVQFTDQSTNSPTSWEWDFGDNETSSEQNPVHTYAVAGNYTVNLTVTNTAGSDSKVKTGYIVITDASASLPWQDNCESLDGWTCSKCALTTKTIYEGNYSIGCDPSQLTSGYNIYTSAERTINIPAGAKTLRFDALSLSTNYVYNSWVKVFLDGNEKVSLPVILNNKNWKRYEIDLTGIEPGEHTFKIGSYMDSWWGNAGFYIDNIWVIPDEEVLSNVNVSPSEAELQVGDNITFSAQASTQYGERLTDTIFTWSSSDDSVGKVNDGGIFTALSAGNVTVNATADGVTGSATVYVASPVLPAPVAAFTANVTSGEAPLTVQFTDESTGSPTSWFWDFGDGTNAIKQNVSHTYTSAGNYTVNLTVSNADGSDFEVKTEYIIVSEPLLGAPVANFTANRTSGKAPLDVQFTDVSTGNVSSYSWDFDNDGTVDSTEQNPIYTYSAAGTYTVNLTVSNEDGNDSEVKTGYIKVSSPSSAKPVAAFSASPTSGKTPLKVAFTDTSTGSPTSWKWDFGDGSKSYLQNPIHKYSKAGIYTVNLTVKNAKGSNTVTKTEYIKVITKPVANFSADPTSGKVPLKVAFTDTSTGIPAKWIWDFGDGSKSFHQNPTHKYSKAGIYTVNLTVKNAKGSNTVTKTEYIKVITKPVANFTSSVTSGKTPLKVTFTDTSTGIPAKWIWDFGDGSKSFLQNPTHKYSKAGTYTVNLTVKNVKGSNTVTKTDYIKVI